MLYVYRALRVLPLFLLFLDILDLHLYPLSFVVTAGLVDEIDQQVPTHGLPMRNEIARSAHTYAS
jgi:hypothetical protein